MHDLDALKYPIGTFNSGQDLSAEDTRRQIAVIDELPVKLTELVGKWDDDRLDTPYRPNGWTIRQLVHHLADSHMNAYVRTKLALTEDNPTISPYDEAEWAKLSDSQLDVAPSLVILKSLHLRWVTVLEAIPVKDLERTYFHPASNKTVSLRQVIALYAWHSEHHYQHACRLAERNSWK